MVLEELIDEEVEYIKNILEPKTLTETCTGQSRCDKKCYCYLNNLICSKRNGNCLCGSACPLSKCGTRKKGNHVLIVK